MARYGSERIRGHGIPEALEAILLRGSRIEPRVALLKPISAAISIGSGGPFGAEGPIIMTGGAFGSIVAQLFHLTAAERKTLLVAGAAAGMSATFASPVAAVLLAVELLLFELQAAQLHPRRAGQRRGGGGAPLHPRARAALPGAAAARLRRRRRRWPVCLRRRAGRGRAVGGDDRVGLRGRGSSSRACRSTGCGGRRWAAWSSASAASSARRRWASATTRSRRCCSGDGARARAVLLLMRGEGWPSGRSRSAPGPRAACWRRC